MTRRALRFSGVVALFILLFSTGLSLATPSATVAAGLGITGSLRDVTMSPGTTYTHTMTITNNFECSLDMHAEPRGLGQELDGSHVPLTREKDLSPYSSLSYINQIDVMEFSLEPGGSQIVKATLHTPSDATPGTRYACIHVFSEATGSGQVGISAAVIVPITITVPGSEQTMTGEITGLSVSELKSGEPIEILTTFTNSGDYHYKAKNQVIIKNAAGDVFADTATALTSASIIPTFSRLFTTYSVPVDPGKGIPPGQYSVESKVMLEDGTLVDTVTTGLTVPPGYKPPLPEPGEPGGLDWLLVIVAALAGLVVLALAIYLLARRARRNASARS